MTHPVTGFFLIVTFFIIGVSILAVYTTTLATELGLEKGDIANPRVGIRNIMPVTNSY
jgi:hypothetical protein